MTADPQDRERLAKMLTATSVPVRVDRRTWDDTLAWADRLLAAGITPPPAPKPPLLTEQQVGECWDKHLTPTGWDRWDCWSAHARDRPFIAFANAAAEAAIRGRIAQHRMSSCDGNWVANSNGEWIRIGALLALFGLEGE